MKKNLFSLTVLSPFFAFSQVGINTTTPQKTLHVDGGLQITKDLNVGGNGQTSGNSGTSGEVLVSKGVGNPPAWEDISNISGTISSVHYIQGTDEATITVPIIGAATPKDVPGVTATLTVPAGRTQTFLFTVTGYAVQTAISNGNASQGVFSLLQDNTKIASAYASAGDFGDLDNVPASAVLLKSVTLNSGTYTFKVQYTPWSDSQKVNFVPSTFIGYNGDAEAMLTKMQILVYNN